VSEGAESKIYEAPQADLEEGIASDESEFYVVSIRKFTLLFFFTLGIYTVYWFYKNWSLYKAHTHGNQWPVPRAIFSIFFTHSLFGNIESSLFQKNKDYSWDAGGLASLYVILTIVSRVLDQLSNRSIGSPITDLISLATVPMIYYVLMSAQKAVNISQDDELGEGNKAITGFNICWMVLGVVMWALVILGIFAEAFGL